MFFPRILFIAFCSFAAPAASAHEFWIEPEAYKVAQGEEITARLRNGEEFSGISIGYFPRRFTRFDLVFGDEVQTVEGRLGDVPPVKTVIDQDGLLVIAHETTPSTITYKTWEKFAKFAEHKDFPKIEARHQAAGFPRNGFKEVYTRHVKALIAVGDGQGADRALGLATEIVALTNPYAPDFNGLMQVQVLDAGNPRADAQVEVFSKASDDSVKITLHRSDANGIAKIPVMAGHAYLLDAVILRPFSGDGDAVWETLWAALTFAVPG